MSIYVKAYNMLQHFSSKNQSEADIFKVGWHTENYHSVYLLHSYLGSGIKEKDTRDTKMGKQRM